jgi:3-oxoacyl-[acyl-carrier protein] reductase
MALARRIAEGPRVAYGYVKRNLFAAETEPLATVLEMEAVHQARAAMTEDHGGEQSLCRKTLARLQRPVSAMGKLDGKIAIVTGAVRGRGRACARRLAWLGAKVAATDLDLRSYQEFEVEAKDMTAESTVAEIEASGDVALGIEVDVCDHKAVEAMVGRVAAEWGRVDVLVANAGGGRGQPIDTKASTLDPALLHLVLFGTVYSCNAVAPFMKRQRSGKIITVSSVAGLSASPDGGYAHYGAAKAAIAHYTRYLAQELGPYGLTTTVSPLAL